MSSVHDAFVGAAAETTYGTKVAPAQFFEFTSEGVAGKYERIESEALRSGSKVLRSDRFAVNPKGAEGDLKVEVLSKGLDFWLPFMFGTSALGTPAAGFNTATASPGDLKGKSFTMQVGRTDASGVLTPFTYGGGKVKSWELSNAVDGVLSLALDLDFASEKAGAGTGADALAVPTFPVGAELLTFVGGAVTVAGTSVAVSDVSIKGDNGLKTDRYFLQGANSTTKKEPLEEGMRDYSFDLKAEFDGLAQYNRVSSATAAGALAALTLTWDAPSGAQLKVEIAAARFDEGPVNADGAKIIEQSLSGKALFDGTNPAVKVTYKFVSP